MLYFSSIVLVGKLNPAIFHPQWLDRYKIIPSQDAQSAQGQIARVEEIPFKDGKLILSKVPPMITTSEFAELNFPKFKLNVDREKYQCMTLDRSSFSLIKDITQKIFSLLIHTPVKAAGLNFDADIGYKDKPESILRSLFIKDSSKFASLFGDSYQVRGSIRAETLGGVCTIDFDKSKKLDNAIFVHANFHKDIPTENAEEALDWIDSNYNNAIESLTQIIVKLLGDPEKIWTPPAPKK